MKTFKTIHIIQLVTGQPIEETGTENDLKKLILFLCGIDGDKIYEISKSHFDAIIKENERMYIYSIFEQYPGLKEIAEEAKKIRPSALPKWIRKQINKLGKELLLARAERTTRVSAPEIKGSIRFYLG